VTELERRCLAMWREGIRSIDRYCEALASDQLAVEEAFVLLVRTGKIKEKELCK
jgi:hypothetical protein